MSTSFPKNVNPPHVNQITHSMEIHGDIRHDSYFWMKQRDSAAVLEHLASETKYYEAMTESWKPLQETLFEEIKARVKKDDSSAPSKNGPYFYFTQFAEGFEYPTYRRRPDSPDSREEVILDVNEIAKGSTYTSVSGVLPSPDHQMIVYGVDLVGRRFYDLHFKDLKSGAVLSNVIYKTTGNVVWAEDGRHLFYTLQNPETLRAEKVFRYDIESATSTEIFFERDEIFSVYVSKSQNDQFVFVTSASFDSSEVHYIPAATPLEKMQLFHEREPKHEYSLDHGDDGFYVLTNWKAENFRLMKAVEPNGAKEACKKETWIDVVPHRSDIFISDLLLLKSHFVLSERSNGLTQIEVIDRRTRDTSFVRFPDASYVVGLGPNHEYDIPYARLNYQSMVRPNSAYDLALSNGDLKLVKMNEVPTYDASKYTTERVWAEAADGVKIPISIVFRKDLKKPSGNPTLVYGYGSYGISVDPNFRISLFSLLDRGFVYAIAHVRGGSEMGRSWYESGRMGQKKNSFSDFIAATEFLIKEGFADRKTIFASGGSAGGLLMGAVANLRPDLYRGIVSVVPFVDVVTTMLDADIPLTTAEYEQWGNPNEKNAYDYIKSYSPYDNLKANPYPAMLVMTGYHDSQVQYWEPAKYVAKLRDVSTSNQPILFRIDMEAGHSGASGRFAPLKETACQWAFLIKLAENEIRNN